ncbi:MAG: aminotransferase class I/II-fold pyridoxal phosphate-dependent enzyme [Gemella sp.]|nr:aminotransferase class I/II-fold pyridoxal phosphate-dependent enzyme [Gemella sp.]
MSFFSKTGQNMILPKDVLIQSKETNEVAGALNATIGMAVANGKVMSLPSLDEAIKKLSYEKYLPYAPTPGQVPARSLWKEKILKENTNVKAEYLSEPIATTGITQAIDVVANLFSEEGDALLLPDLYWQNYAQIYSVKLGATIHTYDQFVNGVYNLEGIKEKLHSLKEEKISILLNFPNNPTGYTPSKEELESLKNIIKDFAKENPNKKIVILCDDAYFGLFFEENHKNSTLNLMADLVELDNCIIAKLDGITKEYYAWGLRLGYVTYYLNNDELRHQIVEKSQGFLRSSTSSGSALAQALVSEIVNNKDLQAEKEANDKIIEERYFTLKEAIKEEELDKYAEILPFNSGYFFTIKLDSINAHEFRLKLLHDYKLGLYSMDDKHIRIAFSCVDNDNIKDMIKKIKDCFESWK